MSGKQGDAYSGSTAWENAFRARLYFDAPKDGAQNDPDARQLSLPKANYARKGAAIDVRWYEGGLIRDDELPPSIADQIRQVSAHTAANDAFLRCLDRATLQKRAVSHVPGVNYAPKIFAGMTEGKAYPEDAYRGAMERLVHLGLAKGFFAPLECFGLERRAQTTANSGEIVPTEFRPDLFTSALTAGTALQAMGATILTGLTGNVEIPRETGSPAVGWVAENTALPTGEAAFDSLTLTPHHVGAITEMSRQLIMQSSPAVEGIIRQMLSRNIALEIDRAAINGSGTGAVPRGLLNDPDVAEVAFATDLFTTTADMIAAADLANVEANRAFLSTNGVKAAAIKLRDANDRAIPLSETFHDERAFFTNQAPGNLGVGTNEQALIYGDWRDFLVGVWSQLDILVNPYAESAYSKGNILVRARATVDFGVRRPASFVTASGVPGND